METIRRCEKHDATYKAEAGTIYDQCFVCVFEDNEKLRGENKHLTREYSMIERQCQALEGERDAAVAERDQWEHNYNDLASRVIPLESSLARHVAVVEAAKEFKLQVWFYLNDHTMADIDKVTGAQRKLDDALTALKGGTG